MTAEVQSYYPNRKKLILLLAACVVFMMVMVRVLLDPTDVPVKLQIASWVGAPGVTIISIYLLFRLIQWKPSVQLSSEGIHEHASIFSAGFIPWTDIEAVTVYSVTGKQLVGIVLKDNEKFLARLNPVRKALGRAGLSKGYPLIAIPETTISISAHQLAAEINQRLQTSAP